MPTEDSKQEPKIEPIPLQSNEPQTPTLKPQDTSSTSQAETPPQTPNPTPPTSNPDTSSFQPPRAANSMPPTSHPTFPTEPSMPNSQSINNSEPATSPTGPVSLSNSQTPPAATPSPTIPPTAPPTHPHTESPSPLTDQSPPITDNKKSPSYLLLIGILLLAILGFGGYYAFTNFLAPTPTPAAPLPTSQPSPTSEPTPTPDSDPTANWPTYQDSAIGWSIKYPTDWNVEIIQPSQPINMETGETQYTGQVNLTSEQTQITITNLNVGAGLGGAPCSEWNGTLETIPVGTYTTTLCKTSDLQALQSFSTTEYNTVWNPTCADCSSVVLQSSQITIQIKSNVDTLASTPIPQILSTFQFTDETTSVDPITSATLVDDISTWKTEEIQGLQFKIPSQANIGDAYTNVYDQTAYKILNHDSNNLTLDIYPQLTIKTYNGGSRRQEAEFGNLPIEQFLFTEKQYGPHKGLIADFQCKISECTPSREIIFVIGDKLVQISEGRYKTGGQGTENNPYSITNDSPITNTIISTFQTAN